MPRTDDVDRTIEEDLASPLPSSTAPVLDARSPFLVTDTDNAPASSTRKPSETTLDEPPAASSRHLLTTTPAVAVAAAVAGAPTPTGSSRQLQTSFGVPVVTPGSVYPHYTLSAKGATARRLASAPSGLGVVPPVLLTPDTDTGPDAGAEHPPSPSPNPAVHRGVSAASLAVPVVGASPAPSIAPWTPTDPPAPGGRAMSTSRSALVFGEEPEEDVEGGFVGWGSVAWIDDLEDDKEKMFWERLGVLQPEGEKKKEEEKKEEHQKIGQWTATAIVIQEVGETVPMNGGSYSAMMLFSNKVVAAIVACCTLLDYVSTALVSAASATAYASSEFGRINTFMVTLAILAAFCVLMMFGVKESSKLSLAILVLHVATVATVAIATVVHLFRGTTYPPTTTTTTTGSTPPTADGGGFWQSVLGRNLQAPSRSGSYALDVFFGYCVGMVGVTGFEASINYVEEVLPGVFPKTLRNMCYLVLFTNPLMSILALAILPMPVILSNADVVMSLMAKTATLPFNGPTVLPDDYVKVGGGVSDLGWLTGLVAVDAVVVLCGGVLTAFVGVCGLIEVMALDNILPPFLLYRFPRVKRRPVASWWAPLLGRRSRPATLGFDVAAQPPGHLHSDDDDLALQRFNTDASLPTTRAPKLPVSPHFSAKDPKARTRPLIPLVFLMLCALLFALVGGRTSLLGLVFSMSFLAVLASFVAVCAVVRLRLARGGVGEGEEEEESEESVEESVEESGVEGREEVRGGEGVRRRVRFGGAGGEGDGKGWFGRMTGNKAVKTPKKKKQQRHSGGSVVTAGAIVLMALVGNAL
ncbi:hypothetical protein HDU96_002588 [Phlyctochytrium bullatum]|nr:hypothetical protein HDU96_002588 [Phlyctochytrium bullatum]